MKVDLQLKPGSLGEGLKRFWDLSGKKISAIEKNFDPVKGAPVFTANGRYTSRGWTEWTQGFQFGSALLQFEATGEKEFLDIGRKNTIARMAPHLTHTGVHDHGFNNLSTYGNLLRLAHMGKIEADTWEREYYSLALRVSGAVQAMRWTSINNGGFIYSFNGPHSLFVDTIRSCRSLVVAHLLGHALHTEGDQKVNLLHRAISHLLTTARYSIYHGKGRDAWDVAGRTAHESIFNLNDRSYRCPSSQQGFSAWSTWTRGLAWAMLGFAEQLEFFGRIAPDTVVEVVDKRDLLRSLTEAACATSDYYIAVSAADGIPYWDTAAPGLVQLGDYLVRDADPFNDHEPLDSSAAAIAAQGLLRLGILVQEKDPDAGGRYFQAGLTIARTLLTERYLSGDDRHEGLILHSVYHRPAGWDYIPKGRKIPCKESGMWGDYHARELMLCVQALSAGQPVPSFWSHLAGS